MGLFRDLATLRKQAEDIQHRTDVRAQLADGLAAMQQANELIVQQTRAAHLAVHGVPATATIAAVRPTGSQIDFQPVVELDLTVFRGGLPVPLTHREPVPQVYLHRARPGSTVRVKLDPADPQAIWIDWATPA